MSKTKEWMLGGLWVLWMLLFIAGGLALLFFGEKVCAIILPWLIQIALLGFVGGFLVLIPLAILMKTRGGSGLALYWLSILFGITTWLASFDASLLTLGKIWTVMGIFCMGFGVVITGLIGSIIQFEWSNVLVIVIGIVITFGTRLFGIWCLTSKDKHESLKKSIEEGYQADLAREAEAAALMLDE